MARLAILLIFVFGIIVRIFSVYPLTTIIGFDQARDLTNVITIYRDLDVKIIGPTAGNNPNLHHGVLYLYYLIPPLLLTNGNPMAAVYWNIMFSVFVIIVLYFLSYSLFKNQKTALTTAFLASLSYYLVSYSGWLSNPSPTLLTVPLFFFGVWKYYDKKNWGIVLASLSLGLSIQFELFFIYLIPVSLILFFLLKFPIHNIKYIFLSLLALVVSLSTMILTEIKFGFGGVQAMLSAGELVGEHHGLVYRITNFFNRYIETVNTTILGDNKLSLFALLLSGVLLIYFYKNNKELKKQIIFLSIYALSPMSMLVLGSHNAPWFLVGLPSAIILIAGFLISNISNKILFVSVLIALFWFNFSNILQIKTNGQKLLQPDKSALLYDQINAVNYTYQNSENKNFTINTVTNPLYVNAVWSYHYLWYGKPKYGRLPSFSGGDQIHPYDSLPKVMGDEEILYLIMDESGRVPQSHLQSATTWANEKGKLNEEVEFGDIKVKKYTLID